MINEYKSKLYCREDISKIENYDKAVADTERCWECHHRKGASSPRKSLLEVGEYQGRPAAELIFLPRNEHRKLHRLGKKMAESTKRKLSELCSGWHHTAEAREKIGAAQRKPVVQYTKSGEFVAEYESTRAAGEATHIGHIDTVCIGKRKTAGGFVWRYKE